jgi:hypothetical protein
VHLVLWTAELSAAIKAEMENITEPDKIFDILLACSDRGVAALVLLDLSAAFDTVDCPILLSRLFSTFCVADTALHFFSSYLCNRTESVIINDEHSPPALVLTGVPQGAGLGPLFFCLYTTPLATILSDSPITYHFYADDT